ncbi:MAG: iron-containing alcohol dehydrogenase, partial [Pirellulales bacterium]
MESNGRVFAFHMPHLVMGCGARHELPALVGGLGRRVMVVTDPGVAVQPLFEQLILSLIHSGLHVGVFRDVVAEPPVRVVEACVAAAEDAGADVLLGVGGGSTLDVTKVAAVKLKHAGTIPSLYGANRVPGRGLPTVLVPTTSGTGSEVTPIAVLSDEEQDLKIGIVSDYLLADHAVVDPQLCASLPPEPTAYTGMDALTHAIESFTSRIAVPLVDALALDAIRLVSVHLRTAVNDGANEPARCGMALASLLGGLCLKAVNCAAVHALAYPLGGRF